MSRENSTKLKRIVKTVIRKCLGAKQGERIVIVYDNKIEMLARTFYRVAKKDGLECALLKMAAAKMHGQEPPKKIAAALKSAEMAVLLTSMSLSHTRARKEASKAGARMASLPGITPEIFKRSIELDYTSLKKDVAGVVRRLTKGKKIEVCTDKGTHLTMSIRNRYGCPDNGLYTKPGAFGNLPAGEACIAPCEGTTQGTLVVDASAPFAEKLKRPIKMTIKDGLMQDISLAKVSSAIKPLGRCALNIAEFGIGLNPKAKVTGNILEDEKAKQTAHLAIGTNTSFGGSVSCQCHLDFVFFNPCILIDGRELKL